MADEELYAEFETEQPQEIEVEFEMGNGGTNDHDYLYNRDKADQHPISAITNLTETLVGKQDTIEDLDTIRAGASDGATAVQPSDVDQIYNAESANAQSGVAVASAISGKQDSLPSQTGNNGKFLTTNGTNLSWATVSGGGGTKVFSNCIAIVTSPDSTYSSAGYNYKTTVMCTGMTSTMTALVIFAPAQADSGNFASICNTSENLVYVYSKENITGLLLIPTIIGWEVSQ